MSEGAAYFISDAHLGSKIPGFEQRERHLYEFLEGLADRAATLFIVGDLFDFWIEYRHAIRPSYFEALHHFKNLADRGCRIHYLAGNHDFALGAFLHDAIGIHIHDDAYETVIQNRKILLYHGDGIADNDWGYRLLRRVLRNQFNQRLYKFLLHPNLGIPLGDFFSGFSRNFLRHSPSQAMLNQYRAYAWKQLSRFDAVIYGHTHAAEIQIQDEKVICNTGEWIRRYNYAVLENGRFTLWQHFPDQPARQIRSPRPETGMENEKGD